MKTLLLVRHGTTDWVDNNILHGITDIPLNANGLRQAREVAEALKNVPASHLYSSSLTALHADRAGYFCQRSSGSHSHGRSC